MFKRLSVAIVGACAITGALILGMSEIAQLFEQTDSQVYMRVMDFIPGSGARRLPDRRMPEAQPERAVLDAEQRGPQRLGQPGSRPQVEVRSDDIDVRIDLDEPPAATP